MLIWCFDILVVMVAVCPLSRARIVKTLNGDIEGFSDVIDGVTVDIFLGIPFAKPPIGDLRFRAPVAVDNWSEVRETKIQPNSCMQTRDDVFTRNNTVFVGAEMWNANTNISEDCLYLNLFVPRTNNLSTATLVWIFGGSYVYGSATLDIYDGRYLAAKGSVILAAVQYRMGVHGFLYTGTAEAPGNQGLLDQQMALVWIYDNVEAFGGDRTKISLFGESAGAASVSHHLFAPSSWPYFNGAVMLSSTSFSPWALESTEENMRKAYQLGRVLNCDVSNSSFLIECLRKVDAQDLELNQWDSSLAYGRIGTFVPVVDGDFLPAHPDTALDSGTMKTDADIILGVTEDEGEFFLLYFFQDVFPPSSIFNPAPLNKSQFIDTLCKLVNCSVDMELDAILYIYEMSQVPSMRGTYRDILDDVLGDLYFKCPVRELANVYESHGKGNVYTYAFNYRHSANPWPAWMGALHGYEIELMFGQPHNHESRFKYNDTDRAVSDSWMTYLAEFANYGSLSMYADEWPAYTADSEEHIVYEADGATHVEKGFRTKECSFWKFLLPRLRQLADKNPDEGSGELISLATRQSFTIVNSLLVLLTCLNMFIPH